MQPRCLRGLPKAEKPEGNLFSVHQTIEKLACRGYSEDVPNRDLHLDTGSFWPIAVCRQEQLLPETSISFTAGPVEPPTEPPSRCRPRTLPCLTPSAMTTVR